jgi:GTPase SAR1 family protein
LIGNKSDLLKHREVAFEDGLRFQKDQGMLYFAETSAKSGTNVDKLFIDIAKFIYHKYKDQMNKIAEYDALS